MKCLYEDVSVRGIERDDPGTHDRSARLRGAFRSQGKRDSSRDEEEGETLFIREMHVHRAHTHTHSASTMHGTHDYVCLSA